MAQNDSRWVTIGPRDTVIFSSHPIPGNEAAVGRVRSGLARQGAKIVHSGQVDVHTTGHGTQQELLALHSVSNPELFVPVHGEYEHLVGHADLAVRRGMAPENVLVATDGDQLLLTDDGIFKDGQVSGEYVMMDGRGEPLTEAVLDERLLMGQAGFVSVTIGVDLEAREIDFGPTVASRGWASDGDRSDLERGVATAARKAVEAVLDGEGDLREVERATRRSVGKYVADVTRRRPIIVPIVRTM